MMDGAGTGWSACCGAMCATPTLFATMLGRDAVVDWMSAFGGELSGDLVHSVIALRQRGPDCLHGRRDGLGPAQHLALSFARARPARTRSWIMARAQTRRTRFAMPMVFGFTAPSARAAARPDPTSHRIRCPTRPSPVWCADGRAHRPAAHRYLRLPADDPTADRFQGRGDSGSLDDDRVRSSGVTAPTQPGSGTTTHRAPSRSLFLDRLGAAAAVGESARG
jgi:hypothetical protein